MIEVSNLTKDYGATLAIDRLNFSVKKGEVVGFLGPNGAGKTTTMKIITGSMAPSTGEVRVAGFDVFENPVEVKRHIGYLPETPPLYPDMIVKDYLSFVARLKGVARTQVKSHVEKAIEQTNLKEVHKRVIQNLSKGFRQRVGIAQALVSDPELLILDEPTVGLDPRQMIEIRALIQQLRGHHTIILSTHILPEVQAVCERVIIINRGRIVAEDTLSQLGKRMATSKRISIKVRLPSDELMEELKKVNGVKDVKRVGNNGTLEVDTDETEDMTDRVASAVLNRKAGLLELRTENFNLEEIFIKLTSETSQNEVQI